jgi:hypothetical protein
MLYPLPQCCNGRNSHDSYHRHEVENAASEKPTSCTLSWIRIFHFKGRIFHATRLPAITRKLKPRLHRLIRQVKKARWWDVSMRLLLMRHAIHADWFDNFITLILFLPDSRKPAYDARQALAKVNNTPRTKFPTLHNLSNAIPAPDGHGTYLLASKRK